MHQRRNGEPGVAGAAQRIAGNDHSALGGVVAREEREANPFIERGAVDTRAHVTEALRGLAGGRELRAGEELRTAVGRAHADEPRPAGLVECGPVEQLPTDAAIAELDEAVHAVILRRRLAVELA